LQRYGISNTTSNISAKFLIVFAHSSTRIPMSTPPTAFSEFKSACFETLSCSYPRFVKKISPSAAAISTSCEAILILELASDELLLSICAVNYDLEETRIFQKQLSEAALVAHMEDDIGLCDEAGIRNFGSRFAAAIKKDLLFDQYGIMDDSSADISLNIMYDIADLRADTTIKLPLLQDKLHVNIYKLLLPIELLSRNPLISIKRTSVSSQGDHLESDTASAAAVFAAPDVDTANTYVSQPEAAKRRKGGGVKLLNSGRRR
jgi:hypothetical protein